MVYPTLIFHGISYTYFPCPYNICPYNIFYFYSYQEILARKGHFTLHAYKANKVILIHSTRTLTPIIMSIKQVRVTPTDMQLHARRQAPLKSYGAHFKVNRLKTGTMVLHNVDIFTILALRSTRWQPTLFHISCLFHAKLQRR